MKLQVDVFTAGGDAQFNSDDLGQLRFWAAFLKEAAGAIESRPGDEFDIGNDYGRFKARYGDIDRIDLTWEL